MPTLTTTSALTIGITALVTLLGTSAVAEMSAPGDLLYSVKTEVNEPLKTSVAFSTRQKAEVEADLAIARLNEARSLALEGNTDTQASVSLQKRFSNHHQSAINLAVEAQDADTLSDYHMQLAESHQTLANTSVSDVKSQGYISVFTALALQAKNEAKLKADSLRAGSTTKASVELEMDAANAAITSMQEMAQRIADSGVKLQADVEAKMSQAVQSLQEANAKLQAEAYTSAKNLATQAKDAATNIKASLETSTEVDVGL